MHLSWFMVQAHTLQESLPEAKRSQEKQQVYFVHLRSACNLTMKYLSTLIGISADGVESLPAIYVR